MTYLQTIAEDTAGGEVADLYDADRRSLGYVANYTKAFSHRPAVFRAWQQLNTAIKGAMDLRRYELATVAAARRLRSSYCVLAHGKVLAERFMPADQVRAAARDHRRADLDVEDIAAMDLADKVAADAASITEADLARLRELGWSDVEILDVILAAAARCFFSKVLDATGTRPDSPFRALDADLREVLTVGRPIAER